jgi:flagellar protein FlaG
MGFSLTGAHVVFFVAAVIVAGTVSGVFIAVTLNTSSSFSEKGDRLKENLDTEFMVINDPENIPIADNNYVFYLKNIGNNKLITTNETFQLFIDGEIILKNNFSISDESVNPSDYTEVCIAQSVIDSGYHKLMLIGPLSVKEEFVFEV